MIFLIDPEGLNIFRPIDCMVVCIPGRPKTELCVFLYMQCLCVCVCVCVYVQVKYNPSIFHGRLEISFFFLLCWKTGYNFCVPHYIYI